MLIFHYSPYFILEFEPLELWQIYKPIATGLYWKVASDNDVSFEVLDTIKIQMTASAEPLHLCSALCLTAES